MHRSPYTVNYITITCSCVLLDVKNSSPSKCGAATACLWSTHRKEPEVDIEDSKAIVLITTWLQLNAAETPDREVAGEHSWYPYIYMNE